MTEICTSIIDHPSAWRGDTLGGKEAITVRLTEEHLAAFDRLLHATRDKGLHEVRAPDFDDPAIDGLLEDIYRKIMSGVGIQIISGLSRHRYDDEQMERIYWGIGSHWGKPAVQSVYGDLMGYVQAAENDPYARAYRSSSELNFHCDTYEFVGLACVQRAESGGVSRMVSSLAVHNELLRTRPDVLPALYEGYYLAPPELQHSERPATDVKTPIFCYRDGLVSCTYAGNFLRKAAKVRGEPFPEELEEAMQAFDAVVQDERMQLNLLLDPGDMMFWHNYTNLHARTAFENSAEHKRKLLRLWLTPHDPRPVDPRFMSRAQAYAWYYEQQRALAQ